MNVSDMVANDLKRCVWILRTCLPMHIVAYLLIHTHQSKFNWLFNAPWAYKITLSMNVSDMFGNDLKRCVWILRTCLPMHIVAYLLNYTHQSKFNWLINAPWAYKITVSMNVSDMFGNDLKWCVWILRTCLPMHIVAYLLNYTHQSKFNWLINAPWAFKITVSMNASDMVENDLKRCVWILRTCLPMHIVAYLLKYTHQSKFNWLFNAPWAYKITISMNVSDMVANDLKQCVWILRTCLPMHIVAYLLNYTHQSKFNWLFNSPWEYKNTVSMNVSDMVENDLKRCVWILRTCLPMHIVAYLLNYTHQSKFNWLINAPWAFKITVSMNASDMVENDLKRCVWILRTCLPMHIVAYLLIHTHQSKFNWLFNAPWAYKITLSMNVSDMFGNDLKRCVWILRTCLPMHIVAYLLKYTHQSKFNWLFNAPWAYKITISMNVSDMVANDLKRCVWILRTCLQMHSCIPLNPHPPEQIQLID